MQFWTWLKLQLHVSAERKHEALQLHVFWQQYMQHIACVCECTFGAMCSCWAFEQKLTSLTFTCPHFKVAGNILWELSQNNAYLWSINFIRTDRISSCINGCHDCFHQTCYWSWRCLEVLLQCERRGSVETLNSIREKLHLSSCCFLPLWRQSLISSHSLQVALIVGINLNQFNSPCGTMNRC